MSELNCSNYGIADLTGIEYFTELVALNCENNKLTALDVSKNTHLSEIYCGGNQLATLDLTGLPIKGRRDRHRSCADPARQLRTHRHGKRRGPV
ncbi:MAG: hypothetical protein ACLSHG_10055 [Oscillospiraceae bacterium]